VHDGNHQELRLAGSIEDGIGKPAQDDAAYVSMHTAKGMRLISYHRQSRTTGGCELAPEAGTLLLVPRDGANKLVCRRRMPDELRRHLSRSRR